MRHNKVVWFALAAFLCGIATAVYAAEHGGTSASTASTSTTAMPVSKSLSARGSISGVDLQDNSLKLTEADGKVLTLSLDPKATRVLEGGQFGSLARLKVGEKVTVRYMSEAGKQIAKSIEIETPAATSQGTAK